LWNGGGAGEVAQIGDVLTQIAGLQAFVAAARGSPVDMFRQPEMHHQARQQSTQSSGKARGNVRACQSHPLSDRRPTILPTVSDAGSVRLVHP